eukprot:TRINITY_DN3423_c0_g1_i5.p1 TRINITY_DN3423_c0_g1~~TRINITY_DN3423_c0_g1_i5.p1  ORF type:complete len:180 (+),score=11.17 TRINITY_DN3423_c0_g1_i5:94-633(+)
MQRRVRTDMQRPVRRLSKSIPGTHGWCYLKDKTYYAYTKKESELLEKAYVSKCPSWILVIRETPYEVNFKEMMQVNLRTRFTRKVARYALNDKEAESVANLEELKVQPEAVLSKLKSSETDSANEEHPVILCKICCSLPQATIFLPCGHLGCCKTCAHGMKCCPFCNGNYTSIIDVYQT